MFSKGFFLRVVKSKECVIKLKIAVLCPHVLQYISMNFVWMFIKGGYLDFSHLTELKNIYITEMYMKK